MTAFDKAISLAVQDKIKGTYAHVRRIILPVPQMTVDQFIELFVEPEDVEFVRRGREVLILSTYDARHLSVLIHGTSGSVSFTVPSNSRSSLAMPRRIKTPPADNPLWGGLVEYYHKYDEFAREWVEVMDVFKYLNETCTNPMQVRYMWPTILAFLEDDAKSDLIGSKVPRSLPSIPVEMRQSMRNTATTVAMAGMLAGQPAAPVERNDELIVSINSPITDKFN